MMSRILYCKSIFGNGPKSIIRQMIRKTATNSTVTDNILIYSNKEFKLMYARLLAVTAPIYVGVMGAAIKYRQQNVQEEVTNADQVYQRYGNYIVILLCVTSGAVGYKINSFIKTYIREIFVSHNHRKITLVLYKLFGKPRVLSVPVDEVMLKNNRVIVKNLKHPLILGKTGYYPNQSFFNKAMGLYRRPFQ